ncbi:sensor histidine kinase [Microtetraspora fusca]|uniref:histidine kinase n=1 Tax=Microtetraspora fusca TaxID=1997 RepID=A0ABW6V8L2_MICFU
MKWRARAFGDAVLWAGLSLPLLWAGTSLLAEPYTGWEVAAGVLLIAVEVAIGRSRPLAALLLAASAWVVSVAWRGDPTVLFPPLAVMAYLAGARMERVRPALYGMAGPAGAAVILVPLMSRDLGALFFAVTGIAVFGLVPWLAGRARYQHLALARTGWERAERLELEQRMVAEQARLRERHRIAGDMHDLLGHELSLVALRIGGLEVAPDLDPRHREAAGAARAAVTAAAERLAEIVEVLRDDSDPGPSHESVEELVEGAQAAGMRVELHGAETPGDGVRLPPMRERALRRVVQEGLTNAAKHAPGAAVAVRITHAHGGSVVSVSNAYGRGGSAGSTGPGGGRGLAGLAERVRLCGGSLTAGPRDDGYELVARLPHAAGPGTHAEAAAPSRSSVQLAEARRRVHRSRFAAVGVALAMGAAGVVFVLGFMVWDGATSVLRPADFVRLRVGQAWSEVAAVLPGRTRIDDPVWPEPPAPAGAVCRYYGTHPNPFDGRRYELYRLCRSGGRLVSKDFLPHDLAS